MNEELTPEQIKQQRHEAALKQIAADQKRFAESAAGKRIGYKAEESTEKTAADRLRERGFII